MLELKRLGNVPQFFTLTRDKKTQFQFAFKTWKTALCTSNKHKRASQRHLGLYPKLKATIIHLNTSVWTTVSKFYT